MRIIDRLCRDNSCISYDDTKILNSRITALVQHSEKS